jgi:hypothetical protein
LRCPVVRWCVLESAKALADWDTDRVKAELERRGLKPHLDTGALPTKGSFHLADPDGYDLQIEGTLKAGDSLLKKTK